MTNRLFGEIPEYPVGSFFESRRDLSQSGVHRPLQAGISGGAKEGADSIVLSGGYEDDQDFGSTIIYTGHGGRNPDTGQQVSDQLLTGGNLALAHSCIHGLPIRIRAVLVVGQYIPRHSAIVMMDYIGSKTIGVL